MIRRYALIVALLALCSLLIVACGDDDDEDATDGDGAAATATTTTSGDTDAEATESEGDASPTPVVTPTLPPADLLPATATTELPPESALVIPPERDESIPRDGRVLGNPDAPVSIVEYGDFQ